MARATVDVNKLHAALDSARQSKELSWRQLAKEIGVSPSTLSRLANDLNPDVNAFAAIVTWLNMPAENFIVSDDQREVGGEEDVPLLAELAPLLRARSDLKKEDVDHLEALIGSAVRRFAAERAEQGS